MIVSIPSFAKKNKVPTNNELQEFNTNFKNYNQKITIVNEANQNIAQFNIALADTPEKQSYGLMNIDFLPENLGMLFVKNQPQQIFMWMKNTKISLDMIFLDENYQITHIESNTAPYSLQTISSPKNSIAVLEIKGGVAEKLKIRNGYKLLINK